MIRHRLIARCATHDPRKLSCELCGRTAWLSLIDADRAGWDWFTGSWKATSYICPTCVVERSAEHEAMVAASREET